MKTVTTQYTVVRSETDAGLCVQVNRLLKTGWCLYFAPFVRGSEVYQAMILKEEADE